MARIVFAILPQDEADKSARRLAQNCDEHRSLRAVAHRAGDLDLSILPESATVTGSYTKWSAILGGVIGTVMGALFGAWGGVLGMDTMLGTILGGVSGVLIGLLCAIMSGYRQPLPLLLEAGKRTQGHESLLTVEAEDERDVQVVTEILQAQAPRELGVASS